MTYNDLADAILAAGKQAAESPVGRRARLGFNTSAYSIPVSNKPAWVWVRIEDGTERAPAQAWNKHNLRMIPDLPVRVIDDGKQLVVAEYDADVPSFVGDALGIMNTNEPGSGAMEPISARRISDGLIGVHPDGGKQVYVYPFMYNSNGADYWYAGGALDLTSYWPSSGAKRWVKLGFDPVAAVPVAASGSDFPIIADIPKSELASIAFGGYFTMAGVQVIGDQTGVISEQQFTDFTPWRSGAGTGTWQHAVGMAGRLWGGTITDNGDGTVAVAAGAGLIKADEAGPEDTPTAINQGQSSDLSLVSWDAVSSLALTDDAYNYLYYDGSAEAIVATTNFYAISFTRDFTVGRVYRDGTTATIRLCGTNLWNFDRRVQLFGEEVFPVVKATGMVVAETGARYLTVTAGILWAELVNRFSIVAMDTSGTDTFWYWYWNGTSWTDVTGNTQIDNTQYNDYTGGTLGTLTPNRYGVHWVYMVHNNALHVVYGQGDYTLAGAQLASPPPTLPPLLAAYATIIAKIIVQKNDTNLHSVQAPDPTTFSASGAADHGGLAGLDGDAHSDHALNTHSFVTVAAETRFDSERVLTGGAGVDVTDGGAGSTVTLDLDIVGLTEDTAPDTTADFVAIYDNSGTDYNKVLIDNLANDPGVCQGRLSLDSSDPAPTADQTAKTTVYFLPYKGELISIYDGSRWVNFNMGTGVNVAVPSNTETPFDVFAYDNSGSLAIECLAWTNDTTRATALVKQDGVYVKSGATGRRYLGTGRTTGTSGQCEDSKVKRYLWNYYHRLQRNAYYYDSTSHSYSSTTWREWNGDSDTHIVEFVLGVSEEPFVYFTFSSSEDGGRTGIGVNTTATASTDAQTTNNNTETVRGSLGGTYLFSIGYSYVAIVERATTGYTPTLRDASVEVVING